MSSVYELRGGELLIIPNDTPRRVICNPGEAVPYARLVDAVQCLASDVESQAGAAKLAEVERQRDAAREELSQAKRELRAAADLAVRATEVRDAVQARLTRERDNLQAALTAEKQWNSISMTPHVSHRCVPAPLDLPSFASLSCPPSARVMGSALSKILDRRDMSDRNAKAREGRVDVDYAACRARADAYQMAADEVLAAMRSTPEMQRAFVKVTEARWEEPTIGGHRRLSELTPRSFGGMDLEVRDASGGRWQVSYEGPAAAVKAALAMVKAVSVPGCSGMASKMEGHVLVHVEAS